MDNTYSIRRPEVLCLSLGDADALLSLGDGDAALLYIYILRCGGTLDSAQAARELGRSDRDVGLAIRRLTEAGLLSGAPARSRPKPADELPEYPAADIVRRSMESPEFQSLVGEVERALDRILTSPDLKKLFGIYDQLSLPPEVILLLVQYCKDEYALRYGRERNVGFAFIEKEAYDWFHREIMTYEQAEQWIARLERRRTDIDTLRRQLGLMDRPLAPTERKYLTEWLNLGFSAPAILIAADRTVTNTGGLKWKYMDSILQSWHRSGLHTPEEIEKGDKRPGPGPARSGDGAGQAPQRDESKTLAQIDRLLDKMKNS